MFLEWWSALHLFLLHEMSLWVRVLIRTSFREQGVVITKRWLSINAALLSITETTCSIASPASVCVTLSQHINL